MADSNDFNTTMKNVVETIIGTGKEYLFFASLISSDNVLTKEDAFESMKVIDNLDEALKTADIPEEKKAEFHTFCEKGRSILRGDIKRFKEEKNKKSEGSNDGGVVRDCKSRPSG